MSNELAEGRLSGSTFDRYCMVLFAGIAAEALVCGEAEGGENDENMFHSICVLLQLPFIPYGLPNSWSDFTSNCCNADGHPRQAGTQFWDEKMSNELAEGRSTFGRYSMVLFASIAAEALVYGEAEDGENDENMFCSIFVLLQPPLSIAQAHSSSCCHSFGKRG